MADVETIKIKTTGIWLGSQGQIYGTEELWNGGN